MEFKVFQKELELQSRGWIPTFHDVSKEVVEIVKAAVAEINKIPGDEKKPTAV